MKKVREVPTRRSLRRTKKTGVPYRLRNRTHAHKRTDFSREREYSYRRDDDGHVCIEQFQDADGIYVFRDSVFRKSSAAPVFGRSILHLR